MKHIPSNNLARTLISASDLFSRPITFHQGLLLFDSHRSADISSLTDPSAFEAFHNHLHLEDVFPKSNMRSSSNRQALFYLGHSLIKVWAERIHVLLPEIQPVLFYLGGIDTISIRFHLHRSIQTDWVSLQDQAFLRQEQLSVFQLTGRQLVLLYEQQGSVGAK